MTVSWKNCFRVGISAFILFLCIYYWRYISGILITGFRAASPILIGLAIAYVLNILMSFYERHYFNRWQNKKYIQKTKRPVCLVGAILTLIGIVALIVYLVVPELVSCVAFLIAEIPPLIEQLIQSEWVKELLPPDTWKELANIDWMSYVSDFVKTVVSGIGSAVGVVISAVSSVISVTITIFVSLMFSIYLLYGKDTLQRQGNRMLKNYLPETWSGKITRYLSILNDCFHRFIVGQCTEAVILGVLCTIGMMIFRFPYAGMIGTLIGFTALIPVAGAYIGAAVGAIMVMTESPVKALLFLVFIVVLQNLEGNLIYPRVVGKSIGLPAVWVLAAVTVGGALAGIPGMLFGVPFVAAVYRLIREDIKRRERAKK